MLHEVWFSSYRYLTWRPPRSKYSLILLAVCSVPSICALCFEDMEPISMFRQLPCSHLLHKPCIDTWIASRDASCPICRETFYHLRGARLPSTTSTELGLRDHHHSGKTWHTFCRWIREKSHTISRLIHMRITWLDLISWYTCSMSATETLNFKNGKHALGQNNHNAL